MEIIFWIVVFIISLLILIKGADYLIQSAEKLGVYLGFSPFVVGALIVGVGTSLPELSSGIAAVFKGATEIVVANAIGSNITNILLIVGILAMATRKIVITKDLMQSELLLFVVSTSLFLGIVIDGIITTIESVLLFTSYLIYLFYSLFGSKHITTSAQEKEKELPKKVKMETRVFFMLAAGIFGLILGAKYLVDAVVALAGIFDVSPGLISITVVALGTSLPELTVSLKAIRNGKTELAVGNIFGSNAFNILMAVSIPGLFSTLLLDVQTFKVGVPVLAVASFIFFVFGISKRIYRWGGMMFIVFYIFFILKLLGL